MDTKLLYCKISNRQCRHLSINYIIEKKQKFDEYGFPVYNKGNFVYEFIKSGDDCEYCNDSGMYLKNMHVCPIEKSKDICNIDVKCINDEKNMKKIKQSTFDIWR
jgi:hypothetical protein